MAGCMPPRSMSHIVAKSIPGFFGAARSTDAMFLLASISKPISVAALMTLFDQGEFKLDDRRGTGIGTASIGAILRRHGVG